MNMLRTNSIDSSKAIAYLSLGNLPYKRAMLCFCGAFFAVWVSGCSTVDSKPFTKFNAAAGEITKVDASVDAHTSRVKESDMARMALDSDKVKKLTLEFDFDDDIYRHKFKFTTAEEPLFIKWERVGSGLTELNLSFIDYTRLLAQLAGGDLIKTEDFDKLATDLNNNARNALSDQSDQPSW